jgi:hypothetical protein
MKQALSIGLCLATLWPATAALAQGAPRLNEAAQTMLGAWEFSNASRDKVCIVTFKSARTAVGYQVSLGRDCVAQYPLLAGVAGWKYLDDDLLYLLDAQGKALVEFSEVEDGIFEAPTPGAGVLFLQSPDAPKPDDDKPPAEGESGR